LNWKFISQAAKSEQKSKSRKFDAVRVLSGFAEGLKHNIDYLASRKSTQETFRSRCHNLAKSSL
jgi:hypothetical protein